MRVYNTLTKKKEEFIPLEENKVKMYACGITVYDQCHIGHARQAITYDMISQYLRYRGYDVTYVRNYTDVDDKIIARANAEKINALDYSAKKIIEAEEDLERLKVKDADIKPKASESIENIIDFVKGLIDKGYAYPADNGDVYFEVRKFKGYGQLSGRDVDELIDGVRKEIEEGKKEAKDFALWKAAKEGEIYWDSPWGKGRPGWHIECSAMVLNNLGETIDIHGGGKDLIFPHHENEVAQSEALTGKPFAKYWVHNGLIKVNGQKMSKSLGNSMTIKEALDKYETEVIRYVMLSKSYSTEIDMNDKEFAVAEKQLYYFYNTLQKVEEILIDKSDNKTMDKEIEKDFIEAMDDDFNTAVVIAQLFAICKTINNILINKKISFEEKASKVASIKFTVMSLYKILGLLQEKPSRFIDSLKRKHLLLIGITSKEIESLIKERAEAKVEKNYSKADEIRNTLDNKGIILNDTREGTTWDIKELYNLES